MTTAEEIKEAHEAFVSGYCGSSAHDVILAIYPAIPGSVAACIIGQGRSGKIWLLMESILLAVPLMLSFTYLANYTLELSAGMLAIACLAIFLTPRQINIVEVDTGKRLGFLTSQRALINLVTSIAILAVDFHSFPRRYVKTEEYGYSLMDVGAAGFIINNGIVEGRKRASNLFVVRDAVILSVLGVLRLVLVRATGYQHHVTEYGVHANFFLTLAVVKVCCSWWAWRMNCLSSSILSIIICLCHYVYLEIGGGTAWTFSDVARDTFVTANREWIVSMPGYMALYFLGTSIGEFIFSKRLGQKLSTSLVVLTMTSLLLLVALHHYAGPPSRRVANPTFVMFCVSFLLVVLTTYALIEEVFTSSLTGLSCVPITFRAINQQPLLFFLLANVATGLINKSINTLDVIFPYDLIILMNYTSILLTLILYLYINSQKSKEKLQ